jgi:hypothetical protein|tara:strand:- start:36 stop:479 length:444 start_codon:yes stop_codon:yes gene_type:complete
MLLELNSTIVSDIVEDDPVRPHISAGWRTQQGRQVYGLYTDESFEELRAVICVAYTDEIPTCESDIEHAGTKIANFYTVWSYDRGAGREIVFEVANHIKKTNTDVERFVTLSPLTEMAKNFHLKNGAKFLNKHIDCQNFEYELDNWK